MFKKNFYNLVLHGIGMLKGSSEAEALWRVVSSGTVEQGLDYIDMQILFAFKIKTII